MVGIIRPRAEVAGCDSLACDSQLGSAPHERPQRLTTLCILRRGFRRSQPGGRVVIMQEDHAPMPMGTAVVMLIHYLMRALLME